ncbi:MAG: transglutaminase [Flavobacteriaceae bacterium]|nr:transglutaminase [Flavobacteriaceae bacterium]|tara:strand:+ start:29417 stop:30367 length:951 start_codon:yes stop_codon:yes gene_type:complete
MSRFLLFLILFSLNLQAQKFEKVSAIVNNYPGYADVEQLAKRISVDFDSDTDKAKAAFYWLSKNIRYNLRELYNPRRRSVSFRYSSEAERQQKLQQIRDQLINKAFKTKLGVCEEYAQSFKKICDLMDLEAYVIKGYVRINTNEIGKIPGRTNHAWNVIKLNNRFIILDATWAAGYEFQNRWVRDFNPYYWDIPYQNIFKTHFPKERIWTLRFGRMGIDEFFNQPLFSNSFFKTNAELVSPTTGILSSSDDTFTIRLKNLPQGVEIAYGIQGMRFAQKPIITRKSNITTLEVKNPKRQSELILYFNQRDALSFRIE